VEQLMLQDQTYWYDGQPRDAWEFAGVMQADADGKNPKMFAVGLRNPYALAFGRDGKLFATDNGDESIPTPDGDEVNLVEQGGDYGYPYFFGLPPAWSDTKTPIVHFAPHSAPTGVTVYEHQNFPAEYRGNIITALYWRGQPGSGMRYREVVRVVPEVKDGVTTFTMQPFLGGLDRPVALAVDADGALYVADMRGGKADPDAPGMIYKIEFVGN
jgi:glucose/arabinose dehydrogenase